MSKNFVRMYERGFTLIELLIVITVIGILAVAFLPNLLGGPSKARDTERKAEIQKIAQVLVSKGLSPASGCIMSDGKIEGTQVFEKADFGGEIAVDPKDDNILQRDQQAANKQCKGTYKYVKHASLVGYSFGVYAHVENVENANALCGINDGTDAYLGNLKVAQDSDDKKYWCFAYLMQ